ncbi:RHS repeat-associated core domain-containing protein [Snodgrassella alvi]|nr:RHS repeat-associated core domain-containing protein [Snodgrassella alvi]
MPDGRTINNLYYGSGHLHQINIDGHIISDIERDNLHREILRTQGRLNTQFKYDRNSRLQRKQIQRNQNPILPDILIERSYQYDNLDRLVSKKHSKHGQTDYRYDHTGRIEGCRNQRYWETLQYDAAANLLDSKYREDYSNYNLIRCNQLLHFRSHHYRYDEHGRTQTKQTIGATQHYHYDADHRLSEVRIEQTGRSQRYGYVYDALGRRIEKHQLDREGKPYNRTRFLWDGLRMIQETGPNHPTSLYIYTDQNSYEPLARIDTDGNQEQHIRYFHTDLNGCPEELTDENGKILWECSFQLWGKRIHEIEHESVEQNLRYQGQYLDRETGLHYNTFRYYDPDIGRFTQPDPIGLLGGFNLYQYAPNGLTWIDPWGLACKGRSGKQNRLRELADDPKQPKHIRGWLKNEIRHKETGNRKTIRLPGNSRNSKSPGKVLAHKRGKRAKDGYSYEHSVMQDHDLHLLEHRHEGY